MSYVDLHTHSSASDGTDSPAELLEKAASRKLRALALTDHDTIAGLDEAATAANDLNIYFVRGCELSTKSENGEMHILGLWLPPTCETLENFLRHLRERRNDRNTQMVANLRRLGFDITMKEITDRATSSVGRPHMAEVMMEKGYVRSRAEAFEKYLGNNGKAYLPKVAPRPEQACRLLSGLGATAVLAHPLLRAKPGDTWLEAFVKGLVPSGLGALEAWHSAQNEHQTREIISLASSLGLGLSGGSDYHGDGKPGIELGEAYGKYHIPMKILDDLRLLRQKKGLPC